MEGLVSQQSVYDGFVRTSLATRAENLDVKSFLDANGSCGIGCSPLSKERPTASIGS